MSLPSTERLRSFLARRRRVPGAGRFTHVVPLGLSCRVTYQVRRYFGVGVAYPFDWWISPLEGLTRYLTVLDPRRIYDEHGLREVVTEGNVTALESVEFGVQPYHEFPRRRVGAVSMVEASWRDHLPAAAAQHAARVERLLGLDRRGNTVLFVRDRFAGDRALAAEPAAVDALWRALTERFSRCAPHLLLVNLPGVRPPESERVFSLALDDRPAPAPEEWRGEDAPWDAGFGSLRLEPLRELVAEPNAPWLTPSS